MTGAEKDKCVAWVRAHAMSWQVLNRSQWKYQFRGKAMVRFVEEATMREAEVKLLLEYLSSDDCIATLSAYDQSVSSEWKPIRAWYEVSNRSHGNIHAVRLYHGLQTEPGSHEDGPYVIEDGCAYSVETRNFWGMATRPTTPASSSGVQKRLTNVVLDPETNLWNYTLETRTRVQQDIAEYLAATTAFEDVKEEAHFGVRGPEEVGGKPASVGGGRRVTRKVTKNADCTHDVHNTIEIAKPVKLEYSYTRDDGAVRHVIKYRNQQSERVGYPDGAYGLSLDDSINAYGLHDGVVSWLTNVPGESASAADVKFTRHGQRVDIYETRLDMYLRRPEHRVWQIQTHHTRGSSYQSYLDMEADANISRNSTGVLAVRLMGAPYIDRQGVLCAEWRYATLSVPVSNGASGGWTPCSRSCVHNGAEKSISEEIDRVLKGGGLESGSSSGGNIGGNAVAEAISRLAGELGGALSALASAKSAAAKEEVK